MGQLGYGYGSECHLLRYMGRHRQEFDREVLRQAGLAGRIEWVDFSFKEPNAWPDQEPTGLSFLGGIRDDIVAEWKQKWPQVGTPPNWDAIGWLERPDGTRECLLVEAKAHLGELRNEKGCGAKLGSPGRVLIEDFLNTVKQSLSSWGSDEWTGPYYQFANRVAILHFLLARGLPTRLICLYFVGDRGFSGRNCPATPADWHDAVQNQKLAILGAHPDASIRNRIHEVYLHVLGRNALEGKTAIEYPPLKG